MKILIRPNEITPAFNSVVIRFESEAGNDSKVAQIAVTTPTTSFALTAAKRNGSFEVDIKDVFAEQTTLADTFDYKTPTTETLKKIKVTLTVGTETQTLELYPIRAARQDFENDYTFVLVELTDIAEKIGYPYSYPTAYDSLRNLRMPYFEGYPSCISILSKQKKTIERIPISDGKTLTTSVGIVKTKPTFNDACGGVYLKWVNRAGGFSYWLFNYAHTQTLETQTKNIKTDTQKRITYSKTGTVSKSIKTTVAANYVAFFKGLTLSPAVWLYNAEKGSGKNNWIEVQANKGSFVLENTTRQRTVLKLDIKLPELNTIEP